VSWDPADPPPGWRYSFVAGAWQQHDPTSDQWRLTEPPPAATPSPPPPQSPEGNGHGPVTALELEGRGANGEPPAAARVPAGPPVAAAEPSAGQQAAQGDHDSEPGPGPRRSQATLLVEAAEQVGIELFHTDTHDAYAVVTVGDHRETWPVKAKGFRRWLQRLYYTRHGKAAGNQAVQDAIGVLEGKALFEAAEQPVAVRVADHHGAIWLDLANQRWEAVEITPGGWRVVGDPPVRFRRPAGARPLPVPVPGGQLGELRGFCNLDDDGWKLVLGFLAVTLRPVGPYPVLNLLGAQGSAKTTTAKALRDLVDPAVAGLRAEPKDERDLAIAATNSQIVGYDNLSAIPTWLSDALCRLATGGGFATRELYSDAEQALFDFQRPVVLTGIEELAVRGDLADRSLLVDLAALDDAARRDEASFWADYQAARPRLLGALLDAASLALRRLPTVHLDRLPRLADFALWVVAAAPALGMDAGEFLAAYEHNRAAANAMAVEALPVASVVCRFAQQQRSWTGTATHLLAALNKDAPPDVDRRARTWPKTAKALSDALRRTQPNLAKVGVRVAFSQSHHPRTIDLAWTGDAGDAGDAPTPTFSNSDPQSPHPRTTELEKVGNPASPASPASPTTPEQAKPGDARGDAQPAGDAAGTQGTQPGDAAHQPASPPRTTTDLRKQPPWDAGDAGDAPTPTFSNSDPQSHHPRTTELDRVADAASPASHGPGGWRFDQPMAPCAVCAVGTSNRAPTGRPLHLACGSGAGEQPP